MREILKKYSGVIYIALMTAVIVVVLNCTNEMGQIFEALRSMDPRWLCCAGAGIVLYVFLRAATIRFYLMRRGHRVSWRSAGGVTGAGQFYSAITPSSSGGQPMQVVWLRRLGIPVSLGTACVCVKFLGFQMAVLLLGGVMGLANACMVNEQLIGFRWLVVLGYLVNAALIMAVLFTIPRTRVVDRMSWAVIRLGEKLRLVKNREETFERFQKMVKEYRDALLQLLHTPLDAVVIFALSIMQVLSYMGVVVCLYHAFGLTGVLAQRILTMQLMLFIAAAFIPLPGAAGAQESGFCIFFRGIFPDSGLMAAMVCWRFFSYYLLILLGLIMMAAARIHRKERRQDPKENSEKSDFPY